MNQYILKYKKAIREPDLLKWCRWMESKERIVKQDELKNGNFVSTIFLGIDHNFSGIGSPILFETMVFYLKDEEKDMNRYETWEEAVKGHKRMVKKHSGKL